MCIKPDKNSVRSFQIQEDFKIIIFFTLTLTSAIHFSQESAIGKKGNNESFKKQTVQSAKQQKREALLAAAQNY